MLSLATLAAYEAAGVRYLGPLPDSALTTALLEQAASTDWAAHPLAYRPARDQRGRHQGAQGAQGAAAEADAEAGGYGGESPTRAPPPAQGGTRPPPPGRA